jgi:hypothetical protein
MGNLPPSSVLILYLFNPGWTSFKADQKTSAPAQRVQNDDAGDGETNDRTERGDGHEIGTQVEQIREN